MSDKMNVQYQTKQQENSDWFTLLESLETDADRNSDAQINEGCNGILLEVIVGTVTGTPSLAIYVQTTDPAGNDIDLFAPTALTSAGQYVYFVHPHADKTATAKNEMTEEGTIAIPRRWKVLVSYTGTPASDHAPVEIHACYVK